MIPPSIIAFFARPAIRLFSSLAALGLVLLALWWGYNLLTASLKTEVKLGKNQVEAATQNGSDAVNVVGTEAAREAASDDQTREHSDEIRKADGAGVPVASGVNNAGLRSLCARAAYHGNRQCLQFVDPGRMAPASHGR